MSKVREHSGVILLHYLQLPRYGPMSSTDERVKTVQYQNIFLFSHKGQINHVIYRKKNGTGDHHATLNSLECERQISHVFSHMWNGHCVCVCTYVYIYKLGFGKR